MFDGLKAKIFGLFGTKKAEPVDANNPAGEGGDSSKPSSKFSDKAITLAINDGLVTENQASVLLIARDFSEAIVSKNTPGSIGGLNGRESYKLMSGFLMLGIFGVASKLMSGGSVGHSAKVVGGMICENQGDKADKLDKYADYYTKLAADNKDSAAGYEERASQLRERATNIRSTVSWYKSKDGQKFLEKAVRENKAVFRDTFMYSATDSKQHAPEPLKGLLPENTTVFGSLKTPLSLGDIMLESGFMGDEAEAKPKIDKLFEKKAHAALEKMQTAIIEADDASVKGVMALYEKPVERIKVPKEGVGSEKYRAAEAKRSLMQAAMHNALYHGDITAEEIKKCVKDEDLAKIALKLIIREHGKKDISSSSLQEIMEALKNYDVSKVDPASPISKLVEVSRIIIGDNNLQASFTVAGAAFAKELQEKEAAVSVPECKSSATPADNNQATGLSQEANASVSQEAKASVKIR